MRGLPDRSEAASYYFTYIDKVTNTDILDELSQQQTAMLSFLRGIAPERTLHRYAPGKWSIRQALSHINDTERVFLFRAFWFSRGFEGPLPSFDQDIGTRHAGADEVPWERHIEEFHSIRASTISFFQNLQEAAWNRTGVASGHPVSIRALAYIIAGHAAHHRLILEQRYL